ncbi:uncharacterized protein LOC144546658 isoform X2 [Carex rostrata]
MEEVEGASPPSPPPLSSTIDSPPHNPSLSDGNEEVIGENGEDHEQEIISCGDGALSDELRAKIVHQVEYYFSDANLPADKFLLKYTKKNGRGFVPIGVIASFRKMKRLVKDHSLIEAALRTSSNLVVSEDGKKVKRINPLPVIGETKADRLRTVIVENLPENYSEESIRQTFGEVGKIVNICIQDPQSAKGSHGKKEVCLIRSKVHALVEYDSVEAAKKAVATLNEEKDWRSGLRVKHLSKRTLNFYINTHMFDNFITKNKEAEGGEVGSDKDDKEEEHDGEGVIRENGEDHEQEIVLSGDGGLSDELRAKIVHQVEYYFSDANLLADKFLLKYVKKNGRGFVPIGVIASFRKMKRLVEDQSLIEAALRTSSNLVVSKDGKVRRLNPLPVIAETKDDKLRMVMVENLPENYSEESIRQTFGEVGKIVKISIQHPQSPEGSHGKKEVYMIRSKVHAHALVEYDSIEAAENAVATLNDEKNWRSGLRVKRLSKQTGPHIFITKNKEAEGGEVGSEKGDKEEEHAKGRRHNNRNQRKGDAQKSAIEQGHGCGTVRSTSGVTDKPLPGPRMPNGTRGFTLGRGKLVRSDQKPDLQDP